MRDETITGAIRLPGENLDVAKMPAHWLFARLGKRELRPTQVIRDEGPTRAARIFATAATQPTVRARMKEIRACFLKYEHELCAVGFIAHKP